MHQGRTTVKLLASVYVATFPCSEQINGLYLWLSQHLSIVFCPELRALSSASIVSRFAYNRASPNARESREKLRSHALSSLG